MRSFVSDFMMLRFNLSQFKKGYREAMVQVAGVFLKMLKQANF